MKNPLPKEIYQERLIMKNFEIRGTYFRDQTAIIHSLPFRRLKNKTQFFFSPKNDHVCTRIEHVMHVATIAASICKGLNIYNEDLWDLDTELAYAIGLGHDLGHAPFGHAGEEALNNKLDKKEVFIHEINSYRIVEHLANNGEGLNLTYAVKDGIICHNGEVFEQSIKPNHKKNELESISDRKSRPCSYEGCITRFSDKIAYLGRDLEDALTTKLLDPEDIPRHILRELGKKNGEIINTLVEDVIKYSHDKDEIGFSKEIHALMVELKNFNYKSIYRNQKIENYKKMSQQIIYKLFDYLLDLYNKYEKDFKKYEQLLIPLDRRFGKYLSKMDNFYTNSKTTQYRIITDFISGMTDSYALECIKQITIPEPLDFF